MSDVEAEIRQRVRGLLVGLIGGKRFADGVPDSASLREAGLPSTGRVSLRDDHVEPEALRSVDSLTRHVLALRS
ncbi:hypothetical protein [Streptomyces sp. NRRL F-5727]|uniref:hypothetical protein n=1 Tax=Streptomyces sp. NRRL F-5727 TaxID=1463871 RepID=UPI0004CC2115|nr:hypothetical protein [Streptomyces sp. NRRL F-5727]